MMDLEFGASEIDRTMIPPTVYTIVSYILIPTYITRSFEAKHIDCAYPMSNCLTEQVKSLSWAAGADKQQPSCWGWLTTVQYDPTMVLC